MEGCYIPVSTPEEWLKKLDELRASENEYNAIAQICLQKAERYHIENIAKLYEELT
jgi:hypothetical protein